MMRLPVLRVWRAFPELDSFDDTQCRWFTRVAAQRDPWRHLHRLLILLAALPWPVVGLALMDALVRWHVHGSDASRDAAFLFWAGASSIAVVALSGPFLGGLLLRDFFLRRRLRRVVRGMGRCSVCGYSLLGLPIPESLRLPCPECGHECRVDPALHVLTRREGASSFEVQTLYIEPRPFWTWPRIRWWGRLSLFMLLIAAVVASVPLGSHEWALRRQAAQARREAPTAARLNEVIARHIPGALDPQSATTLGLVKALHERWRRVLDACEAAGVNGTPSRSDLQSAFDHFPQEAMGWWRRSPPDHARTRENLRFGIEVSERLDLPGALDGILEAPRFVPSAIEADGRSSFASSDPEHFSRLRELERVAKGHMAFALAERNDAMASRSFASTMALQRHLMDQPESRDDWYPRQEALELLRRWLAARPGREALDSISATLARFGEQPPAGMHQEVLQLRHLRYLAWVFGEASHVRFHLLSRAISNGDPRLSILPPGTWEGNRAAAEQDAATVLAWSVTSLAQRMMGPAGGPLRGLRPDAGLVDLAPWSLPRMRPGEAQAATLLPALITWVAIERLRAADGQPPDSLEALVPRFLSTLPQDPFGTGPFVYRRVDPASDRLGRDYLLYSIGPDGVDDGGVERLANGDWPDAEVVPWVDGEDGVINAVAPIAAPR